METLCTSIQAETNKILPYLVRLRYKLQEFYTEEDLQGNAWTGIKGEAIAQSHVAKGLDSAYQRFSIEAEAAASGVGCEDLDEDKIRKQLRKS